MSEFSSVLSQNLESFKEALFVDASVFALFAVIFAVFLVGGYEILRDIFKGR